MGAAEKIRHDVSDASLANRRNFTILTKSLEESRDALNSGGDITRDLEALKTLISDVMDVEKRIITSMGTAMEALNKVNSDALSRDESETHYKQMAIRFNEVLEAERALNGIEERMSSDYKKMRAVEKRLKSDLSRLFSFAGKLPKRVKEIRRNSDKATSLVMDAMNNLRTESSSRGRSRAAVRMDKYYGRK